MPKINYKDAISNPCAVDQANIEIQGHKVSKTVKLALLTTNRNAVIAADKLLAAESYPVAQIQFDCNRKAFRLQPGDVFKFTYPKYGIDELICRVVNIEEADIESDKLTVTATEEILEYTYSIDDYSPPDPYRISRIPSSIDPLSGSWPLETPYLFAGEKYELTFLAYRKTGYELGFTLYMSVDGDEYYSIGIQKTYAVHGLVWEDYPDTTTTIDEEVGLLVYFDQYQNTDALQSISPLESIAGRNMAVLLNEEGYEELITFHTVTPIDENQYRFYGVYRARLDTQKRVHTKGSHFYFLGSTVPTFSSIQFGYGVTRFFKLVPYSESYRGSLSDAQVYQHTFYGRAFAPYCPINLTANGQWTNAKYNEETISLEWVPRMRGQGTGSGDPSSVVDSETTWEGLFRVKVFVNGSNVRTAQDIDNTTWNYTTSMNIDDNGDYAEVINFKVSNYITGNNGEDFESEEVLMRVTTIHPSTTTTTV